MVAMLSTTAFKSLTVGLVTLALATTASAAFFYSKRERHRKHERSMEISFPSADKSFRLHGNLYLPSTAAKEMPQAKIPAIVIVVGSGPIDRDGNAEGFLTGMKLNTSNRFAEHMVLDDRKESQQPVAVMTYDKRGVGKSVSKDKNLYYRAGMMDLVSDAVEAVRFLQQHPNVDPSRIIVMGHSEGAILLPLIFQKVAQEEKDTENGKLTPIKGCIFLAGLGENIFDAMTLQQESVIREVKEEKGLKGWVLRKLVTKEKVQKQFNNLVNKIESNEDADFVTMYCGLAKLPAKWFREHQSYYNDAQVQAEAIEHMNCHCLAITGQKDVQVRNEFCVPDTAKALVPKAASMESHRPPNLTHALRSLEGPARLLSVKKDYTRLGKLPLDPELLSLIDNWCDRVLAV